MNITKVIKKYNNKKLIGYYINDEKFIPNDTKNADCRAVKEYILKNTILVDIEDVKSTKLQELNSFFQKERYANIEYNNYILPNSPSAEIAYIAKYLSWNIMSTILSKKKEFIDINHNIVLFSKSDYAKIINILIKRATDLYLFKENNMKKIKDAVSIEAIESLDFFMLWKNRE